MSTTADQIKELRDRLDALAQVQTQEEFDEGARLHNLKNAPWVSGMYSHLPHDVLHPRYAFQAYPAAMYHVGYAAAMRQVEEANGMRVAGSDMSRDLAIKGAMAELDKYICIAKTEAEERMRLGSGLWASSPDAAETLRLQLEADRATAAGHLAYENRNLIGKAKEELDAADAAADDHLVDVPAPKKKPGRPAKVMA